VRLSKVNKKKSCESSGKKTNNHKKEKRKRTCGPKKAEGTKIDIGPPLPTNHADRGLGVERETNQRHTEKKRRKKSDVGEQDRQTAREIVGERNKKT